MSQYGWDDAPPVVTEEVNGFVEAVLETLGSAVAGVYLHGSLATGAFNPERSDIDLLVVTERPTTAAEKTGLAERILELSGDPAPIETSVVVRSAVHPWSHPAPFDFHYSRDWRDAFRERLSTGGWDLWGDDQRDPDLAGHVTMTRKRGIRLHGDPVDEALPPVPPADYRDSILADLEWGSERRREIPVYFVLNACRVYQYLVEGAVSSKDEGGAWALETVPAGHRPVVERALAIYRGEIDDALDPGAVDRFADAIEGIVADRASA